MDIDSIVKDLMKAERAKLYRYEQERTLLEWKREDYRSVNNTLRALRELTSSMRLQSTFLAKSVSSSDESVVTATAATSGQGTYDIVVTRLASAATKVGSSISADPGNKIDVSASLWSQQALFVDGAAADPDPSANFVWGSEGDTFSFTINGEEFTFANTVTLKQVFAEVNAREGAGVTMFYDSFTDRVVITTKQTGNLKDGDEIVFTDDPDGFLNGLLQFSGAVETGGENAQFSVNGLATERSSNTFQINGVTFTLRGVSENPLQPARVEVATDTEAIYKAISEWVSLYNSTVESIYAELHEARYPDYKPLTEEQMEELTDRQMDKWEEKARSGLLKHDSLIMSEMTKIRVAIYSTADGLNDSYNSLASIGITTGHYLENGKLHINEQALRDAIEADPEKVMRLFTNSSDADSEKGVAVRVYERLGNAIDRISDTAGRSADLVDMSSIGQRIRSINERISREEERLQKLEDRYWRQFTVMEQWIARMNAQSAWLTSMFFGGMNGV
jgi:flagellar hook-associated protein 2